MSDDVETSTPDATDADRVDQILRLAWILYILRYILLREVMMETAKIFENGKSQAVRLPKKFRFEGDEVFVHRLGHAVMLIPKEHTWQTFLEGLNSFTDDFCVEGRPSDIPTVRDVL